MTLEERLQGSFHPGDRGRPCCNLSSCISLNKGEAVTRGAPPPSRASAYANTRRAEVLWRAPPPPPWLSLVVVSGLCGRTNSDRRARCVIDFNLESAACCSPPHSLHSRRPAGPPSCSLLGEGGGGVSLIVLLWKTH